MLQRFESSSRDTVVVRHASPDELLRHDSSWQNYEQVE